MKIENIQSIRVKDLQFGYEARAVDEESLLLNANVELPAGKVVRLCGPAGAGKSAILKLMAGLISPLAGTIEFNGLAVSEMSFEEFLPFRLKIGYGFDLGGLLNNRTLAENLALPLLYHDRFETAEVDSRVNQMLELFQLKHQGNKRPSTVAGSQRKATCVARALVMSPEFLILDDPTTGLSNLAKAALIEWIKSEIKSERLKFVLISSEELEWAAKLDALDLEVTNRQLIWADPKQKARTA